MITIEKLGYGHEGTTLEAHLALPPGGARVPAIVICHAFSGQSDLERGKAERIATELGYVGAALDLYGRGVRGASPAESAALMRPFVEDRALLRRRLLAALDAVRAHPRVEGGRMAAIGLCFGGMCALDLARAGADLRGVVSFHGLFAPPQGLEIGPIRAKVLVLHGHDDPMAPPDAVRALEDELTRHGADWQVHVYGHAQHAFTNPMANDPARGTVYEPRADRRSWIAMKSFLEEIFSA